MKNKSADLSRAQVGDIVPINILALNIPGNSIVLKREEIPFKNTQPKGLVHLLLAPLHNHKQGGWYSVAIW